MGWGTTEPFRYESQRRYNVPWRPSSKQIAFAAVACFGLVIIILVTTMATATASAKGAKSDGKCASCIEAPTSDTVPTLYFAKFNGTIMSYSPGISELATIIHEDSVNFLGIDYDPRSDKLYWSMDSGNGTWSICRANRNGSEMERILHKTEYKLIFELAVDWVTGNVYGASLEGIIFVCDPKRTGSASCAKVLTGQGKVEGIALNPTAGLMYFSSGDSIIRSEMDGSNRIPNFIRVNEPRGVFIDLKGSRLYWSSAGGKRIQSSNMVGGDIRTVVQLGTNSHPQGIAVMDHRVYWTDHFAGKLESSNKDGTDVQTLYDGTDRIMHLVVVPGEDRPGNRSDPCVQQCDSRICVLTATTFRCLS